MQVLHCDPVCFFLAALTDHPLRQHDILQHGVVREEVEELEHHTDLFTNLVDVRLPVGEMDTVNPDIATINRFQVVDTAQQRALAGAARPDDDHHLTAPHAQANTPHCLYDPKGLVDVLQDDHVARRNVLITHQGTSFVPGSEPLWSAEVSWPDTGMPRHSAAEKW